MRKPNAAAIATFLVAAFFIIGGIVWQEPYAIPCGAIPGLMVLFGHFYHRKWVIPSGWHYSLHWPGFWLKQEYLGYVVTFTESCRYDLGIVDQLDWNKLFGIGFGLNHHHNSVRFAWRYNFRTSMVELGAYWYVEGVRRSQYLTEVPIGSEQRLSMFVYKSGLVRMYQGSKILHAFIMPYTKWPHKWGLRLFPYFGGNVKAPHRIIILKEKLA